MLSVQSDATATITVPLTRGDGEPFVPDSNQVSWELRGHGGAVIIPATSVTGVTDSSLPVEVLGAHHELTSGRVLEKRTLTVSGSLEGFPFEIRTVYRVHDFLNITASSKDVRTFIGTDAGELGDEEIDLVDAYFDVAEISSIETLQAALAGDEAADRAANRAIVAQAVINLIPSLPARLSKSESDGSSTVERFSLDLAGLERRAITARDKALATVTGSPRATTTRALIAVTQRTDPLTGA